MGFFKELQRRKVIRVGVVYVVTAWVLIQVADVVTDPLRLPDWFATAVIVLLALGFPVSLGLAWAFEVRPESGGDENADAEKDGTAGANEETNDEPEPYLITHRSVAALPFENVGNNPEVEQVATGLTEEILNNLSKMQDLKVASRASTLAYKDMKLKVAEIAQELGVSYLVEGSIRKLGDDLRITAQLIRAPDDEHIWAQTFERKLSDGFAMQEKLAQVISRQAQASILTDVPILSARKQTKNARAYRHFRIAAEERWQQVSGDHTPNWKLVLENYRRAVELDPGFAVAHEGIANVCMWWFELGLPRELASRMAHEAIERAKALRPPSAFTYFHSTLIYLFIDANYPAALRTIDKGLALAPNMAWLHVMLTQVAARQGRLSDALGHLRTAAQLSPGDSEINGLLGSLLWLRGDITGAVNALEASLENMRGGVFYIGRATTLARLYHKDGQIEQANRLLDSALHAPRHDTAGLSALCLALSQAGRTADLQTVLTELEMEHGDRWFPGRFQMHLAAGEMDLAFRYLNEGIEQRHIEASLRIGAPFLELMREDGRWQETMAHLEDMEARAAAGE